MWGTRSRPVHLTAQQSCQHELCDLLGPRCYAAALSQHLAVRDNGGTFRISSPFQGSLGVRLPVFSAFDASWTPQPEYLIGLAPDTHDTSLSGTLPEVASIASLTTMFDEMDCAANLAACTREPRRGPNRRTDRPLIASPNPIYYVQ